MDVRPNTCTDTSQVARKFGASVILLVHDIWGTDGMS